MLGFGKRLNRSGYDDQIDTLIKYISLQVSRGKKIDEARSSLKQKGWPDKYITEAIRRYNESIKAGDKVPEPKTQEIHRPGNSEKGIAIKIDHVSKAFGYNQVLDDVNLTVNHGDLIGIIGLSGSGKSTILNTIIGFYKPDIGRVFFNSKASETPSSSNDRKVKKQFGFAPQDPSFYRRLTTWENLDHFGSLYKIKRKERKLFIDNILNEMGLSEARNTLGRNLSGGMQRRLSIACSMIHKPEILILDEPTADLDPYLRNEIWNLIRNINKTGTTVLLTSHFLSEVEGLCNKIAILHDKKIRAFGTPDELKDQYSTNQEVSVELTTDDYGRIVKSLQKDKLPISEIAHRGNRLVIYTKDAEKVLHHMIHHIEKFKDKIIDIDLNKPSLNEIFESYIKKAK